MCGSRPGSSLPARRALFCGAVSVGAGCAMLCRWDPLLLAKAPAATGSAGGENHPIALAVLLLRCVIAFVVIDLLSELLEPHISFHENVQEGDFCRNEKPQTSSLTSFPPAMLCTRNYSYEHATSQDWKKQ